ncbi:MAG: carboxypeptidase-like regulatory domain-containing protein, partial [Flavobacteriaceae bacterium]|nr:carboxypeptidase-like regulatory domain-containing protein [Flavobacteriaceae bacterium]
MKTSYFTYLFLLFISTTSLIAQTATIKGLVLDENNQPVSGVNVTYGDENGTMTDLNGFYLLKIPANQEIVITFSHISNKNVQLTVKEVSPNTDFELNPVMKTDIEQIGVVELMSRKKRKRIEGITTISPEAIRKIPGANAGVETLI